MNENQTMTQPRQSDVPQRAALPTQIDVRINSLSMKGNVLATASATLNGCFAIRGIKIVSSERGTFVSMPRYQTSKGYMDVCFPCTREFHDQFQTAVLGAYQQALTNPMALRDQEAVERQESQDPYSGQSM